MYYHFLLIIWIFKLICWCFLTIICETQHFSYIMVTVVDYSNLLVVYSKIYFSLTILTTFLSLLCRKFIKSFLQGFLPGLALKIFLYILPTVLLIMSKIEGHIAMSTLERRASAKYYYFMLVNVFLGSIVTGTAFEQLHAFLHQSPTQ